MEAEKLFGLFKRKKKEAEPYCAAVVVAAGSSTRMGRDKLMLELAGTPVVIHTLRALDLCPQIHEIIVVTREDLMVPISKLCAEFALAKVRKIVVGGSTRAQSVYNGVQEVSKQTRLIAIHDGARPLVSQNVLQEVIAAAAECNAAAPAVPVKDTIKCAENGIVTDTPDRAKLYAVQTPQVFEADVIRAALYKAVDENQPITDDCSAVELLGMKVTLTQGADENIKITTPADLVLAEALLTWRNEGLQ